MNNTDVRNELIESFGRAVADTTACRIQSGRFVVDTAFQRPDGDHVQMFIWQSGAEWVVSDLGETLRILDSLGFDLLGEESYRDLIDRVAEQFDVRRDGGVISRKVSSNVEVGPAMLDLLQASLAIGNLYLTAQPGHHAA